jgi:hypothetical protein
MEHLALHQKIRGRQRNHIFYIKKQVVPETKDNEYNMLVTAVNSIAGFDGGSDNPMTYKDVLKHKDQTVWWISTKMYFHAIETKGVCKI